MYTRFIPCAFALAVFGLGFANPAAAIEKPKTEAAALADGKYILDKSHASITFMVKHLGYSNYTGRFNDIDATLQFNAKEPAKSALQVTVKTASVDTNNAVLQEKLKKEDAFNVEKFATATFTSTAIEKISDTSGIVKGNLTLLGVTKPVSLKVTFNGGGMNPFIKKDTLGFSATTVIKRSEFGMDVWNKAVGDDVTLLIEAEFNRE